MRATQTDLSLHLKKVKHFHDIDAMQYKRLRYRSDTCEGLAYVTRKALVLDLLDLNAGRVLDIGCGPGILTEDLLRRNLEVYSADLSTEMIKHARAQAGGHSYQGSAFYVASDASGLCFSDSRMDSVLCIGVVCYVRDYMAVLSEIHRVLKPGGTAVIQIDNIKWPTVYRRFVPLYRYLKGKITSKRYDALDFEFNLFSRQVFFKDLEACGFRIAQLSYYDFRIPFFDILLPGLSIKLASFLFDKRSLKFLRHFAHGLLIKCRKA